MPAQILTTDDLREFKLEMLSEIKQLMTELPPQQKVTKRYLKSNDLQELLDLSPTSLQNLRNARILPYTKIGGTFFYDWEDIVLIMNKFKKPAKPKV